MTDDSRTPDRIQAAAATPTSRRSSTTDQEAFEDENVAVDALTGEVIHGAVEDDEEDDISWEVNLQPPRVGAFDFHTDAYGQEQLDVSRGDFEALLNQFEVDFKVGNIREGEIVSAKVLRVTDSSVILEFGFKSEGAVPREEFKDAPQPGEEVEVLLESREDEDGVVVLSKKKADFLRVWEKIKEAYENDRPVKGTL